MTVKAAKAVKTVKAMPLSRHRCDGIGAGGDGPRATDRVAMDQAAILDQAAMEGEWLAATEASGGAR